jgi:hypothetical protein
MVKRHQRNGVLDDAKFTEELFSTLAPLAAFSVLLGLPQGFTFKMRC